MAKVRYTISLADGVIFDSSDYWGAPLDLAREQSPFPPRVHQQLERMTPGGSTTITLDPEEAYGPYDQELVFQVKRSKLPADYQPEVGAVLSFATGEEELLVTVREVSDDSLTLDANHPLAGRRVVFELELLLEP